MEVEKSKNRILLGSLQSVYVESVLDTDIKISIKQPVEGWKSHQINPQVNISSEPQTQFLMSDVH